MSGQSALVVGLGSSGRAAARWLACNGWEVAAIEDSPARDHAGAQAAYPLAQGQLHLQPSPEVAAKLARQADLVVPSPGVPMSHPAIVSAAGAGVPVKGEVELAWSDLATRRQDLGGRARLRLVAITGTNGKTTVTELVTSMLVASGLEAVAAGNIGLPLLDAVGHVTERTASAHDPAATVLVAEVSSFQLQYTDQFAPDVSCWLNFSPDHLDWHPDLDHYARAKARVWANQTEGSTTVLNADDPVVMHEAANVPRGTQVVTFASTASGARADWRYSPDGIAGPDGQVLPADQLPRAFPHDLANTAAAFAVALAAGGRPEGCVAAARMTKAPRHRVEFVAERDGVGWYDDSKATTPASVLAAVAGFTSVVLIAGGRNKGLDLSILSATAPPVRHVVAIGESAPEIAKIFDGRAPVQRAGSMESAVGFAASACRAGDAVLLSPGCASFDWYASYAERGEHFSVLVKEKLQEVDNP